MPIYEYQCNDCKHQFEEIVTFGESEKHFPCEKCESNNVDKLVSVPATHKDSTGTLSSKGSNFNYMAGHNIEKAQDERRNAENKSHMGKEPHPKVNDIERFGEGTFHKGKDY